MLMKRIVPTIISNFFHGQPSVHNRLVKFIFNVEPCKTSTKNNLIPLSFLYYHKYSTLSPRILFCNSNSLKQQPPKINNENDNINEENGEDEDEKPLLMNFVPKGMPNIFYSFANYYFLYVIRSRIDRNFRWKEFIDGAKQALIAVSSHLSNNRLDELNGLVEENALKEIRKNYQKMTLAQRQELELLPSDIILAFAHHINIETLKEEFTGTRKHIVNLFIVFDCIKNLEEILKSKVNGGRYFSAKELFEEFAERKIVCNYEFRRIYIENKNGSIPNDDWTITKLLHIKEKDFPRKF